jgi:hypothetical protein
MDLLEINGFNVPPGKGLMFQEWVRENSDALAKAMPEGCGLVGIYASVFSSEKRSGDFKLILRLDSYAAIDRFSAAMREDSEFSRLMDELGRFGDVRLGADRSDELLKSVADVTIWGDVPE